MVKNPHQAVPGVRKGDDLFPPLAAVKGCRDHAAAPFQPCQRRAIQGIVAVPKRILRQASCGSFQNRRSASSAQIRPCAMLPIQRHEPLELLAGTLLLAEFDDQHVSGKRRRLRREVQPRKFPRTIGAKFVTQHVGGLALREPLRELLAPRGPAGRLPRYEDLKPQELTEARLPVDDWLPQHQRGDAGIAGCRQGGQTRAQSQSEQTCTRGPGPLAQDPDRAADIGHPRAQRGLVEVPLAIAAAAIVETQNRDSS